MSNKLTFKEGSSRKGKDTSKDISRPAIAPRRRSRVRSISTDHIINCCHVDAIVCDSHDSSRDRRTDPVERWSRGSPSENNEANGKTRGRIQKPPETGFILRLFIVGLVLPFLNVTFDDCEEREPADNIADEDRDKGQTQFKSAEAPLIIDEGKRLDKHEDEGIAETTEER
jgi:hypothetical protein